MLDFWRFLEINLNPYGIEGGMILVFVLAILVIIIALIVALVYFIRLITLKIYKKSKAYHNTIYLVKVPKYSSEDKKDQAMSQQQLAEKISLMESVFDAIGGLKSEKGWKRFFKGAFENFSFEIVLKNDNLIYFYVVVPDRYKEFIEQQITAQFPKASLEETVDYNIFLPDGEIAGTYLKFNKEYIYPIKTYKKLETDSLNAITNALSKLENAQVAIQLVVRSAPQKWHSWGRRTAFEAKQGRKLNEAIYSSKSWVSSMRKTSGEFMKMAFKTEDKQQLPKEEDKKYTLSQMEEETLKNIEEKSSEAGLEANIRIVVSAKTKEKCRLYLDNIVSAYSQFNYYEYGNSLVRKDVKKQRLINDYIYRLFDEKRKIIINVSEATSLYHLPFGHTETPNIVWLEARKSAPPTNMPKEGPLLGMNDFRGYKTEVRISDDDRRRHMYIIGMTGTGKSWFQANMAIQDINNGKGLCVIDPHGDMIDELLEYIPKERAEDVIVFDPSDYERPMALNMMEYETPDQKIFVVNELLAIFDKLYDLKQTGGPMFEQYMRNALLLIMDDPESGNTILEVPRVLADEDFRRYKLDRCKTEVVKNFWIKEAEKAGGEAALENIVPYVTSKLTSFIANDLMRPIISQQKSSFRFRKVMDEKKILLVKLAKGKIGDINANLLGMIIVGKLLFAALSRVDVRQEERTDFYLYIDEFQNFLTDSIKVILSEARKYKLCLTIAHQYIGQLVKAQDTEFKDAIFGNVGTKVAFRVGVDDAEAMAKEFAPVFDQYDVMNVPKRTAFIKLLIDNANPPPFHMQTLGPEFRPEPSRELAKNIFELSRLNYGRDREEVEAEILERMKQGGKKDFLDELLEEEKAKVAKTKGGQKEEDQAADEEDFEDLF